MVAWAKASLLIISAKSLWGRLRLLAVACSHGLLGVNFGALGGV